MYKYKFITLFAGCLIAFQSLSVFAYDTSAETLTKKHTEFASQYDFHEGDYDKSFDLYPGIAYTSGIEYREDGSEYECPAIYIDAVAMYFNSFSSDQAHSASPTSVD